MKGAVHFLSPHLGGVQGHSLGNHSAPALIKGLLHHSIVGARRPCRVPHQRRVRTAEREWIWGPSWTSCSIPLHALGANTKALQCPAKGRRNVLFSPGGSHWNGAPTHQHSPLPITNGLGSLSPFTSTDRSGPLATAPLICRDGW